MVAVQSERRKIIISSLIGNVLEWYDYTIYGYLAYIIAELFFPSFDKVTSIIATFCIFTAGFVARPFGGLIFGYIGDEYGRKKALYIAILLMAFPTGFIGLLPTYDSIGIFAPILLCIIRVVQGVSLGGEFSSSATYLIESAPEGKRGLYGSVSTSGLGLGVLIAAFFCLALEVICTKEQMISFGWRVPFLVSFIFGFCGIYIRKNLSESQEFQNAKELKILTKSPIKDVFTKYPRQLCVAMLSFLAVTVPFYILCVFSKTMMSQMIGYSQSQATALNMIIICSFAFFNIIFGFFVDRFNKVSLLLAGSFLMAISVYPSLKLVSYGCFYVSAVVFVYNGLLVSIYQAPFPSVFASLFGVEVRLSALSVSYNVPAVLFGGTAPIVASFLMQSTGSILSVCYYVSACCIVSFFALLYYRFRLLPLGK